MSRAGRHDFTFSLAYSRAHIASVRATETQNSTRWRRQASTAGESAQNLLCAYLAGAVLVGLVGNSLWGWWWVDPVAGLLVAAVAIKEGREAWRGENCCAMPGVAADVSCGCGPDCTDACCAPQKG
jgi:hypothetical protein